MAKLIPLSNWWHRPADAIVALTPNRSINFSEFESHVAAWVNAIAPLKGSRFAVYHHNAETFLAILCALWQLSRTACIPSDSLPGTIKKLSRTVDGFLGAFNTAESITQATDLDSNKNAIKWQIVPATLVAIEVFTSGTTGEPKSIKRTMQALESELDALQILMPESTPQQTISTVSHHHLYGMTFRLLRPFAHQIAFNTFLSEYLEDVIAQVKQQKTFSLVSSPAHLSRFNEHLDWATIKAQCIETLSSAAPLKREHSLKVSQLLGTPVKEIYGSSETGALAWRIQHLKECEALWQPLSHLALSATKDSRLHVTHKDTGNSLILADQVSFNQDKQFSLHGRMDQIAKIEGKRVSLAELEQVLSQSIHISEAKTITLKSNRDEIAAAIVLSNDGLAYLKLNGHKQLIKQLKSFLVTHFEAVLIPRRWRLVANYPYNSQGKLTKQAMTALFSKQAYQWPQTIAVQQNNQETLLQCYISPSILYFDGHFTQQPILPGVVQLHWAIHFGKQYFNIAGKFKHIENLKFQQIILPKTIINLTLRFDQNSQKLFFSYTSADNKFSSGRVCYE